jgi:hypothetical protein
MVEKALLMVVLALAYCKGRPRHDGSRWILDRDLYHYLHVMDENIPPEPPTLAGASSSAAAARKKRIVASSSQRSFAGASGLAQTPDVDSALDRLVKREELIRAKATDDQALADPHRVEADVSVYYAMGPRSALEVGRRQIVFFCAEILGEAPDPAMIKEIKGDDDEQEEGERVEQNRPREMEY